MAVGFPSGNQSGTLVYHRYSTSVHPLQLQLLPSAGYCHHDLGCGLVLDNQFVGFDPGSVVAVPAAYLAGTDFDSNTDLVVGIDLALGSEVRTDLAVDSDLVVGTDLVGSTHVPCYHNLYLFLDHCWNYTTDSWAAHSVGNRCPMTWDLSLIHI